MKIKEMRAMPVSEAEKQVAELRAELAKERAVAAGGTRPENPGKIRGVRKSIARLLTVINEKKRAGEISGGKKAGAAEAGAKQVEKKAPVAKAISQQPFNKRLAKKNILSPGFSMLPSKKAVVHAAKKAGAVAKQISPGFFSGEKKAVVKKVAAKGKFSPGFLPIGKKAEKGKAKKGVNRV